MQVVDAATTMGLLFGAMGVGSFIGPIGFNLFTPPKCALSGHTPIRVPVLRSLLPLRRRRWCSGFCVLFDSSRL